MTEYSGWLIVVALALIGIWFSIKFSKIWKRNQILSKLPGPGRPWYLGGRTLTIIKRLSKGTEGFRKTMAESVKHANKYGGLHVTFIGPVPFVAASDGQIIREICTKSDGVHYKKNFGYELSKPLLGDSLLITSGDFWKHQRKIFDPGFYPRSLAEASRIVEELILEKIQLWEDELTTQKKDEMEIEMFSEMVRLTSDTIGLYTFSKTFNGSLANSFKVVLLVQGWKIYQDAMLPLWKYLPTPWNIKYWYHLRQLKTFISSLIDQRLSMPATERAKFFDLFSTIVIDNDGSVDCQMERYQLRDEFLGFIFAGHDTTASTLGWALYLLAKDSELQEKLLAESYSLPDSAPSLLELDKLKLTHSFIKEVLRMYPPAVIGRTCLKADRFGEYELPVGSEIFINLYAMQRRRAVWGEDADVFNAERFLHPDNLTAEQNINYLPFGGAPRSCIGMKLAIIEIKIVLMRVLQKFILSTKPGDEPWMVPSLTLHPSPVRIYLSKRT